jgi:hypothetical protein
MILAHTINASIANAFSLMGELVIVDRSILSMYEYYAHTRQTAGVTLPNTWLEVDSQFYIVADWNIPAPYIDSVMRSRCIVVQNKLNDVEYAAKAILEIAGV